MSKNNTVKNNSQDIVKGGDSINSNLVVGDAILAQPLEVKVYNNNFDKALRAFRALVQKERVLSVYKEKQTYEKPSQKRRRKHNEMKRKLLELNLEKQKKLKNIEFVE